MNKKGSAEATVVAVMLISAAVNVTYSMLPWTRASFQEKRAIEICEFNGGAHCKEAVALMPKDAILEYVRDNNGIANDFYAPKTVRKTGGGLRNRILALQK